MITHKEAEILTSARQDAPLDPVVERELQAHLATCDECRAFAIATEKLTAGIQAMPSIPVNPRIRREVMEQVRRGRNPLATLFNGIGGGFQTGPVLAAAATLVIIGLFGWLALDRLVFEDGGTDNNQIAAVPTEEPVNLMVASPTSVPPTETVVPTDEPEPTPEPTATEEPEPTATSEPVPTATSEPVPTATSEPESVATEDPTVEPVSDEEDGEPTDLTSMSVPEETEAPEPEATEVPTEEPTAEPTEEPTLEAAAEPTVEPTEVPTEEPTVVPTDVPTEEPTSEPEPTQTPPPIEPIEGTEVQESDGTEAAGVIETSEGVGSAAGEDSPPIESTGDSESTETDSDNESDSIQPIEPAGDDVDGDKTPAAIEPIEDDSESDDISREGEDEAESEGTQEPPVEDADEPAGQSLSAASVSYTGIDGDPSGHLGLTREGRLEFMQVPDGASRTTSDGFRLESAESQPGVIHLCGDGYCEPALEAPESESWYGDVPLGVIGERSYFLRLYNDRTEVISATSSGTQMFEPAVIAETGPSSAPRAVYENDGIMFAWLPSGEWLEISGGNAQLYSGSYSDPYNLRFAPLANNGPLIGYFSNGTLVVAPVTAPDSPVFAVPTDGIDFDMTGGGSRIAVIRGSDIVIYDIDGNILQVFEGGDVRPGSLIWLNSGIVYVDRNTGLLFQIPETAP